MNIYNNRYNLGVSNTKKGNATTSQVLSGYTFTSASGVNLTGTCNYKYTQDQYNANYNNGYNAGKASVPSKYYSGTLDSNGNGSGFGFIPMIGITYGPYGWTYVFINGSVSAGKFPNKGYISFRYAYTTSSAWENDASFSGFGNGYINWSRSALASQPFKVWGI